MEQSKPTFDHLGLAPAMIQILDKLQFTHPTPIQHKAIPIALQGDDIIGIAQTGTGKTLAFGIPMVQRLSSVTDGAALVLVPTRELAIQVDEVLQKIIRPFKFTTAVLIGGAPMFRQIKAIRRKPRIIIATPGRLMDHMEQGIVSLKNIAILALDEADRMFDMGFAPQVEKILKGVPKERQTLLFSATMPEDIVRLVARHMQQPTSVEIAPSGTSSAKVTQELFIVKEEAKKKLLLHILDDYRGSILLFTRTKIKAKIVARVIREAGHKGIEIHSDRSMGQRKQAIEGFKAGRYRVLVATDIASRGIDVTGIELVINYDLPEDIENYVHRIGRTGRADHEGHAISFATARQASDIAKIEKMIRKELPVSEHPEVPSDKLLKPTGRFGRSSSSRGNRSFRPKRSLGGRRSSRR